ncbi:MAG: hypothetical protein CL912_09840 [Deltaproteobacteria bacterium]|nr:hypothetical protein [Deltaproteobacteria bacterium]
MIIHTENPTTFSNDQKYVTEKSGYIESEQGSNQVHGEYPLVDAAVRKRTKTSSILSILVAGIALFSDGYNAQIIGYMQPLFKDLFVSPSAITSLFPRALTYAPGILTASLPP